MSTGTSTGSGTQGPAGRSLAEQLEGLKQRSGRSYEALAHRTGLGRSTIHRYCQGSTLPGTFGAVDPPWLLWVVPGVIGIGAIGIGLGLRRRAE